MNTFPKGRTRDKSWAGRRLGVWALLVVFAGAAAGQPREGSLTLNFRDTDLIELIQAVSAATGKSFIIDPRIHARVTLLSAKEVSLTAFYDAFLSVLPACGLIARTDGNVVTILPGQKAAGLIRVSLPYLSSCSA